MAKLAPRIQDEGWRGIAGSALFPSEDATVAWAADAAAAASAAELKPLLGQVAQCIVSRARDYFDDDAGIIADVAFAAYDQTPEGKQWRLYQKYKAKGDTRRNVFVDLSPVMDASRISSRLWVFINSVANVETDIADAPLPKIFVNQVVAEYGSANFVNLLCSVVKNDEDVPERVPIGVIAYTHFTHETRPERIYIHSLSIAKAFEVRCLRKL
jgi:hypothetical protein